MTDRAEYEWEREQAAAERGRRQPTQAEIAADNLEAFLRWHASRHESQAPNVWGWAAWTDDDLTHGRQVANRPPVLPSWYGSVHHFEDGSKLAVDSRSGSWVALWWDAESWAYSG